jgi:uncharacterized membrane protein
MEDISQMLMLLFRRFMSAVVHVRLWLLASSFGCHLGITWVQLVLANETTLVDSFITFLYFTATVASPSISGMNSSREDPGRIRVEDLTSPSAPILVAARNFKDSECQSKP